MIFLYCEIGEKVTQKFDEINYEIGQFDWYSFPFELLKFMPTIMLVNQQPMQLLEHFQTVAVGGQFELFIFFGTSEIPIEVKKNSTDHRYKVCNLRSV